MDKATARPWKIGGGQINGWVDIKTESNGDRVAKVDLILDTNTLGGWTKRFDITEANAALIVRAVNEHAALVAVAEAAKPISELAENKAWLPESQYNQVTELLEALANLATVRGCGK